MFLKILASALIAAGIVFLCWLLRGLMLTPLRLGHRSRLTVLLRVTGPEPGLEETLSGLLWLKKNGTLPADIVVEDAGMDDETKAVAALMARGGGVSLRAAGERNEWENPPKTSK